MKTVFTTTLLLVVLAISVPAHAQPPVSGGVDKYVKFDHLTTEHGLSNDSVWGMAQDSDGFMWFGTFDGLNRYDGSDIKVFRHDPDDPHSLSGDAIRGMHVDQTDTLWIGTWGNGLNRFDRATERFIRYRHDPDDPRSLSHDAVRTVYEDRAGTLWVGTMGGLNWIATVRQDWPTIATTLADIIDSHFEGTDPEDPTVFVDDIVLTAENAQ